MFIFMVILAAGSAIFGVCKLGKATANSLETKRLLLMAQELYDRKRKELESKRKKVYFELQEYGKLKLQIWESKPINYSLHKTINIFLNPCKMN